MTAEDEQQARPVGVLVEGAQPLSSSLLWAVNADFYEDAGIAAWASGEVPHLLTSGPMIARSYAQMIEGFCEDVAAGRFGPADPTQPIYVVELGAGPGRLGYYLSHALDPEACEPFRVVYVLSDLVDKNVAFWREHPKLAPFVSQGRIDFARFDASADRTIELQVSGETLRAGSLANPLVVVANYLFDVLPQDLYTVEAGELFEEQLALYSEAPALSLGDRDFLERVFLVPERQPVDRSRYTARVGHVLDRVPEEREGRVLFPSAPLGVLEHLLNFAADRLLLLFGERPGAVPAELIDPALVATVAGTIPEIPAGSPVIDADGVEGSRPGALLAMGIHGHSFSLPVDLDLLSRPVLEVGGSLLLPAALPAGLIVGALLADRGDAVATRRAFANVIGELGPEDLYLTIRASLDSEVEVNLPTLLAVMRVGGYDPYLLRRVYRGLESELPKADEEGLDEAVRVLRRTYELEFPIDDKTDVAYGIAALLAPAARYEDALWFFEESRRRHGPRPVGLFNVALCLLHLENPLAALAALEEAIALDPGYQAAIELRQAVHEGRAHED